MRTRRFAVALAVPAVLGLAACGDEQQSDGVASAGGGAAKGASATPSQSLDPKDAQLKFAQCMRENGIDVPDPGAGDKGRIRIGGADVDKDKMQAAMKKCQPYLQAGGKFRDLKDPKVRDQFVKYAQCMRQNGVDMPDPGPDGDFMIHGNPGKLDQGKMQKAQQACRNLLPGGGKR